MKTDKRVQVIMSTYNGEHYLREQLDSIVNLEYFDLIKVLIRDDGSTDGTLHILKEYSKEFGFDIIQGENVGVNQSLFILFDNCDLKCDYFAISDQDDVWVKDKIRRALKELDCLDANKPLLFASVTCATDAKLNPMGITKLPKKGPSFYNAMIQNVAAGHTQVLNRKLLEELMHNGGKDVAVIDWWIYLVASAIGEVRISKQYTVLHRQHGDNAVGCDMNLYSRTLHRIKRVFSRNSYLMTLQLRDFYQRYKAELKKEYVKELRKNMSCQKDILTRLHYCFVTKAYRHNILETLLYKILYLMGRYKI